MTVQSFVRDNTFFTWKPDKLKLIEILNGYFICCKELGLNVDFHIPSKLTKSFWHSHNIHKVGNSFLILLLKELISCMTWENLLYCVCFRVEAGNRIHSPVCCPTGQCGLIFYPTCDVLNFLNVRIYVFHKSQKMFSHLIES